MVPVKAITVAPPDSFWVGASRAQLQAAITDRRPQQRIPTPAEIQHDPMLAATTALQRRKAMGWKPSAV
jgi:hypothetical protein